MIKASAEDVRSLLPMTKAIELVSHAMRAVSDGKANLPLRSFMDVDGVNRLGIMPGVLEGIYGVKLISLFPGNPAKGLSSHIGAMLLFDPETGAPSAMVDADALTAISPRQCARGRAGGRYYLHRYLLICARFARQMAGQGGAY